MIAKTLYMYIEYRIASWWRLAKSERFHSCFHYYIHTWIDYWVIVTPCYQFRNWKLYCILLSFTSKCEHWVFSVLSMTLPFENYQFSLKRFTGDGECYWVIKRNMRIWLRSSFLALSLFPLLEKEIKGVQRMQNAPIHEFISNKNHSNSSDRPNWN